MTSPSAFSAGGSSRGPATQHWRGLVVILLVLGLLGHVFAARAIGGSSMAYEHHIFGFFFILAVTGAVIALIGCWLWRGRMHVTWLVISAVQALIGLVIYIERFHVI